CVIRRLTKEMRESNHLRLIGDEVCRPFDLDMSQLLRFRLLRTEDFEHRLFLIAHLSIIDGVSAYQILPFELASLYAAYCSGQSSPLPVLTVQFGDYAYWQRHWLQGEELLRRIEYWRRQLAGVVPLNWPT